MKYERLTSEQRVSTLEAELSAAESEHFRLSIHVETAEARGEDPEAQKEQLDKQEAVVKVLKERLAGETPKK